MQVNSQSSDISKELPNEIFRPAQAPGKRPSKSGAIDTSSFEITLNGKIEEMMDLDKKVADRVNYMQTQMQQMQDAFRTLQTSIYDSRNERERGEAELDAETTKVAAIVEKVVKREVESVHDKISHEMQSYNRETIDRLSQVFTAQQAQQSQMQSQQMSRLEKYLEVLAYQMKEIST